MVIDPTLTHKVTIRHNVNLESMDQFTYNSRMFRVGTPLNVNEEFRVIEVMATEMT